MTDDFDDALGDPGDEDPFEERALLEGAAASEDSEALLRRIIGLVDSARAMPLSNSVLVSRDEMLALLNAALERLPDEMRQARWLLKEREEFVESGRREADHLLEDVRAQAERMMQRTEIVRQANQVAQRVEEAREEARRLRHEAEDFCDQKLASFEIVLERTLKTVVAGREKLQATPPPYPAGVGWRSAGHDTKTKLEEEPAASHGFFDQDEI